MKCLVPVKRVIDFNVKIRIKSDGSGVETEHVKMSMNPFDEIALEEAVGLQEANVIKEIIAVSIGPKAAQETLRAALARGADRAILIETDDVLEPLNIAKILKVMVEQEKPDLVILGKQAIDDDCNQTGQMLAGLLGWSQGTFISKLKINLTQNQIEVTREVDSGLEMLTLTLPAVVTADLRLNEPRYISLPNVMRAKSKPLEIKSLSAFGLTLKTHSQIVQIELVPPRKGGIKVESVNILLDKLHDEAKII